MPAEDLLANGDEAPIEIMTWEDFAGPMAAEDADATAREYLTALAIAPTPLNFQMAKRVIQQATVEALREYRRTLENPGNPIRLSLPTTMHR